MVNIEALHNFFWIYEKIRFFSKITYVEIQIDIIDFK